MDAADAFEAHSVANRAEWSSEPGPPGGAGIGRSGFARRSKPHPDRARDFDQNEEDEE